MGQRRNQRGNKTYLKINENGTTTSQILWDAEEAALWEKCIDINTYITKFKRSQINK